MLKLFWFLLAVYYVYCVPLDPSPERVTVDDDDILQDEEENLNNIGNIITAVIKASDPTYVESIAGNLSTLSYNLANVNIRGLKKCIVRNAEINLEALTLNLELACPKYYVEGQYQIKGTILILPIEGNGDFNLRFGKYNTTVNANLVKYQDKNGEFHLKVKNFSFGPMNYLDPITYYVSNLVDGDTKLSDEALKFINNNWRDVTTIIQGPVLNAGAKPVFKNFNAYLKHVPIEKLIN